MQWAIVVCLFLQVLGLAYFDYLEAHHFSMEAILAIVNSLLLLIEHNIRNDKDE